MIMKNVEREVLKDTFYMRRDLICYVLKAGHFSSLDAFSIFKDIKSFRFS